jgi:hypothetical protein
MSSKIIELKLVNEKDALKTYIGGLGNYVEGPEIKQFTKKLEEHLNAKMTKRKNGDDIECGFEGDVRDKIKEFLLSNIQIDENSIKNEEANNLEKEKKEEKSTKKMTSVIDTINKKITLHFVKEKRTSRTYIVGLKNFIGESEMQTLSKKLQKSMGTNSLINEEGDCGFNGDYTADSAKKTIIRNCILENTSIQKDLLDF